MPEITPEMRVASNAILKNRERWTITGGIDEKTRRFKVQRKPVVWPFGPNDLLGGKRFFFKTRGARRNEITRNMEHLALNVDTRFVKTLLFWTFLKGRSLNPNVVRQRVNNLVGDGSAQSRARLKEILTRKEFVDAILKQTHFLPLNPFKMHTQSILLSNPLVASDALVRAWDSVERLSDIHREAQALAAIRLKSRENGAAVFQKLKKLDEEALKRRFAPPNEIKDVLEHIRQTRETLLKQMDEQFHPAAREEAARVLLQKKAKAGASPASLAKYVWLLVWGREIDVADLQFIDPFVRSLKEAKIDSYERQSEFTSTSVAYANVHDTLTRAPQEMQAAIAAQDSKAIVELMRDARARGEIRWPYLRDYLHMQNVPTEFMRSVSARWALEKRKAKPQPATETPKPATTATGAGGGTQLVIPFSEDTRPSETVTGDAGKPKEDVKKTKGQTGKAKEEKAPETKVSEDFKKAAEDAVDNIFK